MDEYDKNDDLDNEDVVRHPWGVSRPWTVKGYTPQRWLSGAPRRQPWPAQATSEDTLPQGLNIPSMPQTTTQTSSNLAAPTELVKEAKDAWRVVHVTAFVVLAISSFGSMLLSYRMYMDKKEARKNILGEPMPNIKDNEYDLVYDRNGNLVSPGDYVSIKTYPRGTARGIVEISKRAYVDLGDKWVRALCVNVDGTLYGIPSSKGLLKLKNR